MKHPISITALLAVLFVISQLFGLAVLARYIDIDKSIASNSTVYTNVPLPVEPPQVPPVTALGMVIGGVIGGTVVLLLLIRIKKFGTIIWKIWFSLASTMTMFIAFSAFINQYIALGIGIIASFFKIWRPNVWVHNISEIFIYGGLASVFVPILNLWVVSLMLVAISIYDMYAVWKSKHMISMAMFMSESKVFAGLSIPKSESKDEINSDEKIDIKTNSIIDSKKKSKEKSEITNVQANISYTVETPAKPTSSNMAVLGGGDIAFPLLFSGVILKTYGIIPSLITTVTAAIALTFLLFYGQKGKFYPAMPFISAGSFIGLSIIFLLNFILK